MLRYIFFAFLDFLPYILGGTDTPHPDAILKLHEFEFGTKVDIWGTDESGFRGKYLLRTLSTLSGSSCMHRMSST